MKTITGYFIAETEKSYMIDTGLPSGKLTPLPKSQIYSKEQDKLYPEMTIFEVKDWLPVRSRREKFDEAGFEKF